MGQNANFLLCNVQANLFGIKRSKWFDKMLVSVSKKWLSDIALLQENRAIRIGMEGGVEPNVTW